uniref:Uncharacterized protein n=1 Tax=Panagrolaimus superbus TaxID=310955 RepID=A0A914XW25_9BILA
MLNGSFLSLSHVEILNDNDKEEVYGAFDAVSPSQCQNNHRSLSPYSSGHAPSVAEDTSDIPPPQSLSDLSPPQRYHSLNDFDEPFEPVASQSASTTKDTVCLLFLKIC